MSTWDPELAQRFIATFRKGIEAEKAALRSDSTAYEVPLDDPRQLEEFLGFTLKKSGDDRLSPGVTCNLRQPSGVEVEVVVIQIDQRRLILRCDLALALTAGDYRLVFVPWFLYDEMHRALEDVPFPESSLRAFGKLPSLPHPHTLPSSGRPSARTPAGPPLNVTLTAPPSQRDGFPIGGGGPYLRKAPQTDLERPLNSSQQKAIEQALESQLTILWGPPGTGKTTTLAELIGHLVQRQRRILIASTTHAALDQILAGLARSHKLAPHLEGGRVVRLGQPGPESFGCGLSEVVEKSQNQAARLLEVSLTRLQEIRLLIAALQPILQTSTQAAADAQQLDLFAEPSGPLSAADLARIVGPIRAAKLAQSSPAEQHIVVSRFNRRLRIVEGGLKQRARRARLLLSEGQQQCVDESLILLSTLANTYVSPLMKTQTFDVVVVEEAGMALLPAIYLAAGRSREQIILVGDPQQLPAILASRERFAHQALGRNIFDVLGDCQQKVMLNVQYRMHPLIGELVSLLFYGGALEHQPDPDVYSIAERGPFPGQAVIVVDCPGSCSTDSGDYSRFNPITAKLVVQLALEAVATGSQVAVITPYRKQVRRIQGLLSEQGLSQEQVHCATVHRFQGQERDVVILDIVDGPPLEPGSLLCGRGPRAASANLLNVSLSRARGKLILVADLAYVRQRARDGILHQVLEAALTSAKI